MNNADLRLGVIVVVVVGVVVRLNQNFIFTRMCLSSQVLSSYLLFPLIPLRSTALDALGKFHQAKIFFLVDEKFLRPKNKTQSDYQSFIRGTAVLHRRIIAGLA